MKVLETMTEDWKTSPTLLAGSAFESIGEEQIDSWMQELNAATIRVDKARENPMDLEAVLAEVAALTRLKIQFLWKSGIRLTAVTGGRK